ncbi:MAG: DedA family protein [Pseudomonadota bacterium]|nr:MAG: DedA family protein [Pseudomonadota bacterium]
MPDLTLWGLFASAFVSSTLFPGGSEAVLYWLANQRQHELWLLVTVASVGNTLGALTTWFLGWLVAVRWPLDQPRKPAQQRAIDRVRRFGSPALLFSWLPVVGDPLCFAAGWLRLSFLLSVLFIALGKVARYAVIVWAT